ncbi:hypothetical protein HJC99_01700 [Candidatus Saccharibacteria bacterium]|nr:hypothetical protein [Candidatus Saccharibacteria bacterium]
MSNSVVILPDVRGVVVTKLQQLPGRAVFAVFDPLLMVHVHNFHDPVAGLKKMMDELKREVVRLGGNAVLGFTHEIVVHRGNIDYFGSGVVVTLD